MIKLHQFPRVFGLPNFSPFCMKVECALRMSGLAYEVVDCPIPKRGPKGKLPFIEDGGMRLGDSELIWDYLRDRYGFDPDAGLDAGQKAASRAFQAMLDERYFWVFIHNRWIEPANWPIIREEFFSWLAPPLRRPIAEWVRRGLRQELYSHGLGRHKPEEIYAFGCADIEALAAWLGDQSYFHGAEPTRIDASLAAHLNNLFTVPVRHYPVLDAAQRHPNLRAYAERTRRRWFPEFVHP